MRLVFTHVRGELEKKIAELQRPVAEAATAAVTEAGEVAVRNGRASIAAAGFSNKWQVALRSDVYPKGRVSMRPAAHIRHKIPYAGVFEEGASIPGQPLLYLPLPAVPVVGGRPLTPKKFIAQGGSLTSVKRPGKRPLLIGKIGNAKAVPMFFGIEAVKIAKKFKVTEAVRNAAAQLGQFYLKHLKP